MRNACEVSRDHDCAPCCCTSAATTPPMRTAPLKPKPRPIGIFVCVHTCPFPPARRNAIWAGCVSFATCAPSGMSSTPTTPTSAYSVTAMPSASNPGPRLADVAGTRIIDLPIVRREHCSPRQELPTHRPRHLNQLMRERAQYLRQLLMQLQLCTKRFRH